jgi:hypothetical protein
MALGDVVAANAATQGSLKQLIRLRLVEENKVSWLGTEQRDRLRVSELADLCPREEVLAASLKHMRHRTVDADLSMIFAHGTALHWVLQNQVLAETGALVGIWRCIGCAKEYGKLEVPFSASVLVHRPEKCECGSDEFLYREQFFYDKEYNIGGHPDGFLVLPGFPGKGIVEAKSISSKGAWEVRQTPNMGHAIQAHCYMWLTGCQWAKILYWDKGGHGTTALVEHTLERDEETIESIKTTIRTIWNGIKTEIPPERICTTPSCPRASKCSLKTVCFEEK